MAFRLILALLPLAALALFSCAGDGEPEAASTGNDGDLTSFELPWPAGETWFLVGGPHCDSNSDTCPDDEPLYALDFAPFAPIFGNLCAPSMIEGRWVTAAAPGTVRVADDSLVEVEHAGGIRSGYYHLLTASIPVDAGDKVEQGDRLGQPSCEHLRGGASRGPHVHFYVCRPETGASECLGDAESLIPAEDWSLAGWRATPGDINYEGTLARDGDVRTAINERCDGASSADDRCAGLRNDIAAP